MIDSHLTISHICTDCMIDSHPTTSQLRKMGAGRGWYTRARQWDNEQHTHLGTLSYLPPEIRQQIWQNVWLANDHRPTRIRWSQV